MRDLLPPPRSLLVAFVVAAVLDIVGVVSSWSLLETVTKPFLAGLLLVWVVLACERRPPWLLVVGLGAALAGDVLLSVDGDAWFLAGMAAFLAMQVCYVLGFRGLGAFRMLRRRPLVPLAWLVLWVALTVVVGPMLGDLRWPIAVYSAALVTMAAAGVATGQPRIAVGGVLFLVSDLLIGLRAAGLEVPASGLLVMTTYCLAQLLIATGWVLSWRWPDR